MKCITLLTFTLNSARDLERLLKNHVDIVDEILVIDNFSQDDTIEVAKKYGAKVFQVKPRGCVEPNRMFGVKRASCDWVLYLDVDEILSPRLRRDLRSIVIDASRKGYAALSIAEANLDSSGRLLLGPFWPDRHIRIYQRDKVVYKGIIHEHPRIMGRIMDLPANIYYIVHLANLNSYSRKIKIKKILNYARLEAIMKKSLGYRNPIAKTLLYLSPLSIPLIWLYINARTILKGYPINTPALIEAFYNYALYLGIAQFFMNICGKRKREIAKKVQEIGLIQLLRVE
ncbi:MAG: glycosyltransferase family 2 protein [Sulfolobales archaeon]